MDQIFKILEVIMSVTAVKSQNVSKQLLATTRKLVIISAIALGSMILFCVGIAIVVADLAKQFDNYLLAGSLLALTSLIIFLFCLSQRSWLKTTTIKNESNKSTPSPVEEALALLIKDIVEERKLSRVTPPVTEGQSL